jgi:uncharacterized protein involved in exopolysaccharide biosynthesis
MSNITETRPPFRDGGPDDDAPRPILNQASEFLGWLRIALRRRRAMMVLVFLLITGLSVAAAVFLPRTYTAQGRILAQSNVQMPALANPRRAIPYASDAPTRSVGPMVLSERNLDRLMHETDLMRRWEQQRSPVLQLKDQVVEWILGPLTEEEKHEALLKLVKRKVVVFAEDEVVHFVVTWYDPDTPVLLVEHLQDILLEERRNRENGAISDALEILQVHAGEVRQEVDTRLSELRTLREERGGDRSRRRRAVTRRPQPAPQTQPVRSRGDRQELADLRADLDHIQRTIREVEGQRQQRLVDVQSTLRQRSVSLGPEHPEIIGLERQLAALRQPSSEVESLRRQAEQLRSEYLRKGGTADGLQDTSTRAVVRQRLANVFEELEDEDDEEDEELAYARAQLALTIGKYEDLLERISGARIELDTANAAFKYRYTVIAEPRTPRDPDKPSPALILLGGVFLGLTVGTFAGLGREVLAGRILKSWQVERFVGLPVLGETDTEAP